MKTEKIFVIFTSVLISLLLKNNENNFVSSELYGQDGIIVPIGTYF